MARLRLGYTKSRTGCLRCKQRRVKCDEQKPCKACVRHGVECSLVSGHSPINSSVSTPQVTHSPLPLSTSRRAVSERPGEPSRDEALPAAASSNNSSLTLADSPRQPSSDPFPYFAKFVTGRPDSQTADWVSDMELLHQWSTSTYLSVVHRHATASILRLWQVEVPQMAFQHTFLLHQILAISAYHLAYLRPENSQQFSLRASQHQNVAIRAMRDELGNVTPENCHALFAASGFLFTTVLAAFHLQNSTTTPGVDDLIDVLLLIKGIGGLLDTSNELLRAGPLKELFVTDDTPDKHNLMLDRVAMQLDMFLSCMRKSGSDVEGFDKKTRAIIEKNIHCLMETIREAVANSMDPEYRIVTSFPIMMTEECVPLLRQKNQLALVLLSYYCVILHASELKYWFIKGWSGGVVKDISMVLEPPWNEHSAWSMGWITAATNEAPE
ncbi:sterol uptake control protein 2 [Cladorrhinum samala]|uniref:Sterol uptake control protein 2 n=1 Tax=Cladorrhinum samala TaxID=585594 RepID=A0AAV9HZH4_9PEZI|nr:sterol uptake control protein 2 [Cladorrhinum samala]